MKTKMKGVLGVVVALVVLFSLVSFALPASADPYTPPLAPVDNTWTETVPNPGVTGGWFYDPTITGVGPIAKAINGDLFAYVNGIDDLAKSVDGGRTWSFSGSPLAYAGGDIVDMVCSEISEDVIYVTDGNYVYKSIDGGISFAAVAASDLERALRGACGLVIANGPITCIDVGYDGANKPVVVIGTKYAGYVLESGDDAVGTVLWIADETFPASWHDLNLSCYGACCDNSYSPLGCYDVYAVATAPDFATSNKVYTAISKPYTLIFDAASADAITFTSAAAAGFSIAWSVPDPAPGGGGITDPNAAVNTAGEITVAAGGATAVFTPAGDTAADSMVSVSVVGGQPLTVASAGGDSTVCPAHTKILYSLGTSCDWTEVGLVANAGDLLWDCDAGNEFEIRHASRFAFPDDYATTKTMFLGVAGTHEATGDTYGPGGDVYRITDIPTTEILDLNVSPGTGGCTGVDSNICSLDIMGDTAGASLMAGALDPFYHQSPTEVYYSYDGGWTWTRSVKDPTGTGWTYVLFANSAVAGTAGSFCAFSLTCGDPVGAYWNQISLIDMADSDVLDLSFGPSYATGVKTMYALLMDDTDVGGITDWRSLFRYDGTYWERVHFSRWYNVSPVVLDFVNAPLYDWVEQSPDFDATEVVYMLSDTFDICRTLNAGCSWLPISYPCDPVDVSAWIVVDENTVLVGTSGGGAGYVHRTTTAGSRPWDIFPVRNCDSPADLAGNAIDFDISPSVLTDNCVALGDQNGQVFFSADLGATWSEVRDVLTPAASFGEADHYTYVAFDPGFATAGDPGENVIYAACVADVGRVVVDPTAASQCKDDWLYLSDSAMPCCDDFGLVNATGIEAVGDTTLYVSDAEAEAGVWRTVDALALINEAAGLNLVEWSQMVTGLAGTGSTFIHPQRSDDLWVTQGSNDLWCLDSTNTTFIWMWADPLAAPVALVGPADGALLTTTATATLEWSPLDAATCYEVALFYDCPECLSTNGMLPVDLHLHSDFGDVSACNGNRVIVCGQTCLPVYGLTPGMKYYWEVRVACDSPIVSKWSDLYTFNTALGVGELCSPRCGEDDIILTTNFSWDAIAGATSYELQVVAASADGTVDFTGATTYTSAVNALASIPGLEYSTVYYWRVRAINNGVAGGWVTCLFTTMDEPEECPDPITPVTIVTEEVTPVWIWVIIGIGGALTIVVIILIVTTRKNA